MQIRIPYYRQENDYFCGPACVQMVLASDGVVLSQARLARLLPTNAIAGTPRKNIIRFLRARGYKVLAGSGQSYASIRRYLSQGWRMMVNYREPSEDIPHLAVLVGLTPTHVILHDPWLGPKYKLPRQEFLRRWHGYHTRAHTRWLLAAKKHGV